MHRLSRKFQLIPHKPTSAPLSTSLETKRAARRPSQGSGRPKTQTGAVAEDRFGSVKRRHAPASGPRLLTPKSGHPATTGSIRRSPASVGVHNGLGPGRSCDTHRLWNHETALGSSESDDVATQGAQPGDNRPRRQTAILKFEQFKNLAVQWDERLAPIEV